MTGGIWDLTTYSSTVLVCTLVCTVPLAGGETYLDTGEPRGRGTVSVAPVPLIQPLAI
jgi:hypothetical protein